ncbi:uncharacterized protein [Rutidosis leptorrhynchoides]|uniref:uncharacterized protein n=1 Tax=Rutidosis leptorrhynchoides TaxID=125765 RepID=UPI003A990E65
MVNGIWITDPNDIKNAFLLFFKSKFQSKITHVPLHNLEGASVLSESERDGLETPITLEEIKEAVWNCGSDKSPGPDGYSFSFIKHFWEILKNDIFNFVDDFMKSGHLPHGSNSSFITLIPKVDNPVNVKDYRPISLISATYKIVAKILANRLAKLLVFKVDFEKAFDSVDWRYLDFMLGQLGFGVKWRSWIKACLSSARTSILVNGSPTSEFSITSGLRQGDPLSPFLFIIVMEGLHLTMKSAVSNNLIKGVTIGNLNISHFLFADDVAIVSEWNSQDLDNILMVLEYFHLVSGMRINLQKSKLYGIGVEMDQVDLMASRCGCEAGNTPFKFLGLLIGSNPNRRAHWQHLTDKFDSKLSLWAANLLSIGGRYTLIKSVLGSLGIYYLSLFRAPISIIKSLEKKRARFFWGGCKEKRKMAWIKWEQTIASLENGGLGIGSILSFNLSLLLKWKWRLVRCTSSLWARTLVAIHGIKAGFGNRGCKTSGVWSNIVASIKSLHDSGNIPEDTLHLKLGNGRNTKFWKDKWLGNFTLESKFNRLYRLDNNPDCLICERLSVDNGWNWDWSRNPPTSAKLHDLLTDLSSVSLSNTDDTWFWNLGNDGNFHVSDARKLLDDLHLPTSSYHTRWSKFIPLKINIFIWRLILDRLPSRINLAFKGFDINTIICPICSVGGDSRDHTFIFCYVANSIWRRIRLWTAIPWPDPFITVEDFFIWMDSLNGSLSKKTRIYSIVAGTFWWLWRFRNDTLHENGNIKERDLFDNIRLSSFAWLQARSKFAPAWTSWLCLKCKGCLSVYSLGPLKLKKYKPNCPIKINHIRLGIAFSRESSVGTGELERESVSKGNCGIPSTTVQDVVYIDENREEVSQVYPINKFATDNPT